MTELGSSEAPTDNGRAPIGHWRTEFDRLRRENEALRAEKAQRHQAAYEAVRGRSEATPREDEPRPGGGSRYTYPEPALPDGDVLIGDEVTIHGRVSTIEAGDVPTCEVEFSALGSSRFKVWLPLADVALRRTRAPPTEV